MSRHEKRAPCLSNTLKPRSTRDFLISILADGFLPVPAGLNPDPAVYSAPGCPGERKGFLDLAASDGRVNAAEARYYSLYRASNPMDRRSAFRKASDAGGDPTQSRNHTLHDALCPVFVVPA